MSKAEMEIMEKLHAQLADTFLKMLERPADAPPLTAAELSAIRQFLKDNGIEAAPVPGSKTSAIAERLPFPEAEDDAGVPPRFRIAK